MSRRRTKVSSTVMTHKPFQVVEETVLILIPMYNAILVLVYLVGPW